MFSMPISVSVPSPVAKPVFKLAVIDLLLLLLP